MWGGEGVAVVQTTQISSDTAGLLQEHRVYFFWWVDYLETQTFACSVKVTMFLEAVLLTHMLYDFILNKYLVRFALISL